MWRKDLEQWLIDAQKEQLSRLFEVLNANLVEEGPKKAKEQFTAGLKILKEATIHARLSQGVRTGTAPQAASGRAYPGLAAQRA